MITRLNLQKKKGFAIAMNKLIGIIIVAMVILAVGTFLFRAQLSKWLNFLPDYSVEEQEGDKYCDVLDSCQVINENCFCKTNVGEISSCERGEFCYPNKGCSEKELDVYKGNNVCQK